jgi:hypothetical protein
MEAEQRRAVALAQRQKRRAQALRLLIAEIGASSALSLPTVEATITCPGVTCAPARG